MGWVFTQHSKGGFCLCVPKLPPWNQCLLKTALREKHERKESFLKTERRGENTAGFSVMFTAPSNVSWLVGKPSNSDLNDSLFCFFYFISPYSAPVHQKFWKLFASQLRSFIFRYFCSTSADSKPRPRDLFHSGSWSHLPLDIAVWKASTNATARPSAGDHKTFNWAFAASQNSPTLYAPRPGWHRSSLKETTLTERFMSQWLSCDPRLCVVFHHRLETKQKFSSSA